MPMTEDAAIGSLTNTLCTDRALYPHHRTHGLALPFGWTNGVPTKPIYCHDTLPATSTHSPLGLSWVAPYLPKTPKTTVVAKTINGPTQGQPRYNNNEHTRLCLL